MTVTVPCYSIVLSILLNVYLLYTSCVLCVDVFRLIGDEPLLYEVLSTKHGLMYRLVWLTILLEILLVKFARWLSIRSALRSLMQFAWDTGQVEKIDELKKLGRSINKCNDRTVYDALRSDDGMDFVLNTLIRFMRSK